jgi:acyl carrier protein
MEGLKIFISSYVLVEKDKIFMDTSLNKDLGLYGEEAYDFIHDFSNTFNVDISQFEFDRYFRPEMDIITKLISKKVGLEKKRSLLYVQALVEAIKKGVLV